jgi:hypothetical protein
MDIWGKGKNWIGKNLRWEKYFGGQGANFLYL